MIIKENQRHDLISYIVEDEEINIKDLLMNKLNISVRFLSKIKKDNCLYVNKKLCKTYKDVKKGDIIEIRIIEEPSSFEESDINIDVLYEDFDMIVVSKPAFMVVHPTKSHFNNTLANAVTFYLKDRKEKLKIRFVNRLDMNTSGVLIVAKNAYAHYILSEDMKDNFEKKYVAIVKGCIKEDKGTINLPIYRPTDDSIKRIVDDKGQESITHFKVIERLKDASVVELILETGRTHQIRVHLSHIGYPIIGDELYGYVDEALITRQALHSVSLKFKQPRTKEDIYVKTELPTDMKNLIEKLRGN